MLKNLKGKHALISGGTRGIGLAIADSFLEHGANVTIFSRKNESIESAKNKLSDYGSNLLCIQGHVGDDNSINSIIAQSESKFGMHQILVNNAGTNPYLGPIVDANFDAWQKTMSVNLEAPFKLSQIIGKKMAEARNGAIINISSVAGVEPSPQQGIYSVSKAGLNMLTKVFARELGPSGVRVNAIMPGVIETKLSEVLWKNSDHPMSKLLRQRTALGRFGKPSEVASLALLLASDESSFVSGTTIPVDGYLVG